MATPKPISMEGLAEFSIDEDDQLYWKGRKVRTSLPGSIQWSAVFIALGTWVLAGIALAEAIHHWTP